MLWVHIHRLRKKVDGPARRATHSHDQRPRLHIEITATTASRRPRLAETPVRGSASLHLESTANG